MRGPINVKSPNNITNWQMRFNSAFKGLITIEESVDWVNLTLSAYTWQSLLPEF
jgi:hypothetical protein